MCMYICIYIYKYMIIYMTNSNYILINYNSCLQDMTACKLIITAYSN